MSIDNLEFIRPLLTFRSADDFYIASVIKRKKENPELGNNSYVAKTYVLPSIEKLDFYYGEMKALSDYHNGRTYINLNRRSFKKVAHKMNVKLAELMEANAYGELRNLYSSLCSKYTNETEKKWIIDVDTKDMEEVLGICLCISTLMPEGNKVLTSLPTKNGYHIITKPFHLLDFSKIYPELDVKKNSPTLLYAA